MSEKEKDIIKTVAEALPKMDERSKGYFLGYAEAMAAQKQEKEGGEESDRQNKWNSKVPE